MKVTVAKMHVKTSMKMLSPVVCALFISTIASTSSVVEAADRFAPPSLDSSLSDFDRRFSSDSVNINFIVAHVLNNARLIEQGAENIKENALLFQNQSGVGGGSDSTGATSGSVVIPPGTSADTIIIINQNDGDSYAIQR